MRRKLAPRTPSHGEAADQGARRGGWGCARWAAAGAVALWILMSRNKFDIKCIVALGAHVGNTCSATCSGVTQALCHVPFSGGPSTRMPRHALGVRHVGVHDMGAHGQGTTTRSTLLNELVSHIPQPRGALCCATENMFSVAHPVGRVDRPHYPGHKLYPVHYVTDYRSTCIVSISKSNTKTGGT